MISFRDKNILVAYIQVFLKEYFPEARVFSDDGTSKVINQKPLKVTGVYDYTTYQVLACYMYSVYPNEKYPFELVKTENPETHKTEYSYKDFSGDKTLEEVIEENTTIINIYPDIIKIPDRVLSYILREVVSPISSRDEIFRIQKLIYSPEKVPVNHAGKYDDLFESQIRETQQAFIDAYTFQDDVGNSVIDLPPNYEGFKVTGYVDPWTEVLYART